MNQKKSPDPKGERSSQNSVPATLEESHQDRLKSSGKSTESRKVPRGGSKVRKLLDILRNCAGEEVDLPFLMRETRLAAVHSGVATLRKCGWNITNRMERHPFEGGTLVHSFYKLTESQ